MSARHFQTSHRFFSQVAKICGKTVGISNTSKIKALVTAMVIGVFYLYEIFF